MKFNRKIFEYKLFYESEKFGELTAWSDTAKPFILFKDSGFIAMAKNGGALSHSDIFKFLKIRMHLDELVMNKPIPKDFKISLDDFDDASKVLMGRIWKGDLIENKTPIGFWGEDVSEQSIVNDITPKYLKMILGFLKVDPEKCIFKISSYFDPEHKIYHYQELLKLYK